MTNRGAVTRSRPGSNVRAHQKAGKSGFQKRKQSKKKRTPAVTSLENIPTDQSREGFKNIDQIHKSLKRSIIQSHKGFKIIFDHSLVGSKISIDRSRGDSKSNDDQNQGRRPKGSSTSDKDIEILFSQMRLDYESNKERAAKSDDPSNLSSFFTELSLTDRLRPRCGSCAVTHSRKVLYEPSLRVQRYYDRLQTQGLCPITGVTQVLRLRKEARQSGRFDVLKDVYGLG